MKKKIEKIDFWGAEDETIITVIIFFMFLRLRKRNWHLILTRIRHTFNFDFYNFPEELFPYYYYYMPGISEQMVRNQDALPYYFVW